ncbi:MAG: thrombospondin type 3 repeat-containing protein [Gammaproteobacteria bacterium]
MRAQTDASLSARQPSLKPGERQFRPGSWTRLEELPAAPLRTRIEGLPPAARQRALEALRKHYFPEQDFLGTLRVDTTGGILYADTFGVALTLGFGQTQSALAFSTSPPAPLGPLPPALLFHSLPGSAYRIYLDFNGEDVSGTSWNTDFEPQRASIPATAYTLDGDPETFNAAERSDIKRIWQRVAEDFAPFNVDVTTEPPGPPSSTVVHVLVTSGLDANGQFNPFGASAGGVAYVDSWGLSDNYVWCYYDKLFSEDAIGECTSHEVGHTLNLAHDGRIESAPGSNDAEEYYAGHGSGETSWAPIMGVSYGRNVTQWSAGNYYRANNFQNDRLEIDARFGYRPDDHGNTEATATPLVISAGVIQSTNPENDPANTNPANKGVMQGDGDAEDVFSFPWSGPITLSVKPWTMPWAATRGGNLDVRATLVDATNIMVGSSDPPDQTDALIQANLASGIYYLHVANSSTGNPLSPAPDGYTTYGSKGQFFISAIGSDADGDGVGDSADNCPNVANADQLDNDLDGRGNVCDNCRNLANNTGIAAQCDSDNDGFGNRCDGDLNNNGSVNAQDTALYRLQLGQLSSPPTYNKADLNCTGAVNAQDTALFRQLLGSPPGPGAGP